MNWFEQAAMKQYVETAANRQKTVDLSPLAGDVWAREHPEEHAKDMKRYEKAISAPVVHNPNGTVTIPMPPLPIYRQMNLSDMQRRTDHVRGGIT